MDSLNVGTVEIYSVELTDRLGNITDLTGYSCSFKVVSEDEVDVVQDWTASAAVDGMRIDCLLNTMGWDEGTYKLYVRVAIPPETPILGPFEFGLS